MLAALWQGELVAAPRVVEEYADFLEPIPETDRRRDLIDQVTSRP